MRIPISWLKDYVDVDEPVAALAERLTLSGLEVEAFYRAGEESAPAAAVEAPAGASPREVLDGEVLEIALTPDLARCMSVIGVAREVAALTEAAVRLPVAAATPRGGRGEIDPVEVEIADPVRCNRYMVAMVRGVAIGESPALMRERPRAARIQ